MEQYKEYAAAHKRNASDMEYYKQVCEVFETRKFCEKCYSGRTEVVQSSKGTGRHAWTALCKKCADAASRVKTAARTTLAQMNKRIKELEAAM